MLARIYKQDRKEILPIIRYLVSNLANIPDVRTVYVFGSVANNSMTGASDIDIAVIVTNPEAVQIVRKQWPSIRKGIDWGIDLLVFPKEYFETKKKIGGVCMHIAEKGKEVFPEWELGA